MLGFSIKRQNAQTVTASAVIALLCIGLFAFRAQRRADKILPQHNDASGTNNIASHEFGRSQYYRPVLVQLDRLGSRNGTAARLLDVVAFLILEANTTVPRSATEVSIRTRFPDASIYTISSAIETEASADATGDRYSRSTRYLPALYDAITSIESSGFDFVVWQPTKCFPLDLTCRVCLQCSCWSVVTTP
jgi:hypothetical protein